MKCGDINSSILHEANKKSHGGKPHGVCMGSGGNVVRKYIEKFWF